MGRETDRHLKDGLNVEVSFWTGKDAVSRAIGKTGITAPSTVHVAVAGLRHSGFAEFSFDLIKTDLVLTPAVRTRLAKVWQAMVAELPRQQRRRCRLGLGRFVTTIAVPTDHADYWQQELEQLLSDPSSYLPDPGHEEFQVLMRATRETGRQQLSSGGIQDGL